MHFMPMDLNQSQIEVRAHIQSKEEFWSSYLVQMHYILGGRAVRRDEKGTEIKL